MNIILLTFLVIHTCRLVCYSSDMSSSHTLFIIVNYESMDYNDYYNVFYH